MAQAIVSNAPTVESHRDDIDGLRAVAVFAVILFHLDAGVVRNGYLGVDIFFVISGYVVSLSVLRTPTGNAWIDGLRFWTRRVMRIFPMLVVATLVGLLALTTLWPPFPVEVNRGAIRTGMAALLGASNWYLHRSSHNYFLEDQTPNIFLHTWSLGVEEQFYVVFSFVFILLPSIFSRFFKQPSFRGWLLCILTIASFATYVLYSARDSLGAFYFLQFRFWELAVGVALAMSSTRLSPRAANETSQVHVGTLRAGIPGAFHFLALLFLALLLICFSADVMHRQLAVIATVIFTASLIWYGGKSRGISSQVLRSTPLVFLGKISYSLYLWHWLVIVIGLHTVGIRSLAAKVVAVAICIVLATISNLYIEEPFRRARDSKRRVYGSALACGLVAVLTFGFIAQQKLGFMYLGQEQRWSDDWVITGAIPYGSDAHITADSCAVSEGAEIPERIPLSCKSVASVPGTPTRRLLLVGDSHAFSNWGMITQNSAFGIGDVSTFTHDGCSIDRPTTSASCARYWAAIPRWINQDIRQGDIVFVTFSWDIDATAPHESVRTHIELIAQKVTAAGAILVVQAPMPRFSRPAYACTHEVFRADYSGCFVDLEAFKLQRLPGLKLLDLIRSLHPILHVWDPIEILCSSRSCPQFSGTKPLWRDTTHISTYGSRLLARPFSNWLLQTVGE